MIDLHMHTHYSDGTDTVEELLKKAEDLNLEIISITDHDFITSYKELEKNPLLRKKYNGKIISGVELRAVYNKINIEILGYGIDYNKISITKFNERKEQQCVLEYLKKVGEKYKLYFNDSISIGENEEVWASTVFSKELKRYSENIKKLLLLKEKDNVLDNFYRLGESNPNSIFYFDCSIFYPKVEKIINDIHNSGGLAFFAHPYLYPFENPNEVIEKMIQEQKIDGIECKHSCLTKEQSEYLIGLCKKYNKYMSGGSDYHSSEKMSERKLGTGIDNNLNINKDFIADWINKIYFI